MTISNADFREMLSAVEKIIMDPEESPTRKRKARELRDLLTMEGSLSAHPIAASGRADNSNHRGGYTLQQDANYEGWGRS